MISKEEFQGWIANPVTQWVLDRLKVKRRGLEIGCGRGTVLNVDSAEKTFSAYSRTVGQIEGLNEILNGNYETLEGYDRIQEEDL